MHARAGSVTLDDVMHLCCHIANCNTWLEVKGLQYTEIAADGEDDVPNWRTAWLHRWCVPAFNNAKVPRRSLQMGEVAFAFCRELVASTHNHTRK